MKEWMELKRKGKKKGRTEERMKTEGKEKEGRKAINRDREEGR